MAAIIISTYFRFLPSSTNSSSKTKWNLNWKAQSICCILYLPNNLTGNMGRAQSHESDAIMITKWLRTSWVLACYSLGSWKFWAWWEKKWQAISFFILMAVAPLRRENLLIRSQTIKIINLLRDVSLSLDLSFPLTTTSSSSSSSLEASLLTHESAGWEDWLVCQPVRTPPYHYQAQCLYLRSNITVSLLKW